MRTLEQEITAILEIALAEDHYIDDVTSHACISPEKEGKAELIVKRASVIAGLPLFEKMWKAIDPTLQPQVHVNEGSYVLEGTCIASVQGKVHSLLGGERTVLNLLQHLSGVAQLTREYVQKVADYRCDILDTRKTLPGLRALQKYAVRIGGGKNHRLHLAECILIKNNHLKMLKKTDPHPLREAVRRAQIFCKKLPIEVEVEDLEMLQEALDAQVARIMLDNMSVDQVAESTRIAQGRAYLEASGGINLSNVRDYAMTGVNGISIGALTHSVHAADLSLRIV